MQKMEIKKQYIELLESQKKILYVPNSNFFNEMFKEISEKIPLFIESFKKHQVEDRRILTILANKGWYIDMNMPAPLIYQFMEITETEIINKAEPLFVEYFRKNIIFIVQDLNEKFPKRGNVLNKALEAHNRGDYELSIPVFLAQADGICCELTGYQFFMKLDGCPAVSKYVKSLGEKGQHDTELQLLTILFPISVSGKDRGSSFNELSRHQILHGEISDYGIEINSLKAISFLNFISTILIGSKQDNV